METVSQARVGSSSKYRLRQAKQTAANLAAANAVNSSTSSSSKKGSKREESFQDEMIKMEDVPLGLSDQLREGIPNSNNPLNHRIQSTKDLPVYRAKSGSKSKKNTSNAPKSSSGVRTNNSNRTASNTCAVTTKGAEETPETKGPRDLQLPPRSSNRNGLTSSASKLRPGKQRQDSVGGNNAEDEHQQNDLIPSSGSEWGLDPKEPFEMNMRLPSSRQRRYRNLSAGGNSQQSAHPSMTDVSTEQRPPSRQRHAFPTDLVDSTAACFADLFCSSSPSSGSPSSGSCDFNEAPISASSAPSNVSPSERPPSRYMTGKRSANGMSRGNFGVSSASSPTTAAESEQSSESSPEPGSRLPSRRSGQPYWCHSHDPKLDGFEDVDETVPPPFRIEVTHDSPSRAQSTGGLVSSDSSSDLDSRCSSRQSSYQEIIEEYDMQRRDLQSRRWSSFSSQEHIKSFDELPSNGQPQEQDALQRIPSGILKPNIEWFKDDQIHEAHLFETVATHTNLPAPAQDPLNTTVSVPLTPAVSETWVRNRENSTGGRISSRSNIGSSDSTTSLQGLTCQNSSRASFVPVNGNDLHLDDMGEFDCNGLNTSLGRDFLSLFAA